MNMADGAIIGGACAFTLGVIRVIVYGKVNKAECDLKHEHLQAAVEDVKEDSRDSLLRIEGVIKDVKTELVAEIRKGR